MIMRESSNKKISNKSFADQEFRTSKIFSWYFKSQSRDNVISQRKYVLDTFKYIGMDWKPVDSLMGMNSNLLPDQGKP